jgi:hypothetical protein
MLKNVLFIIFLVIFMLGFSISTSAQKEELLNKIYAYYSLNGNTIDQGPHQLHGEALAENRSTEDRFGNKDSALTFRGKADSFKLPVNINPEKMPQLTIALWLKIKESSEINTVFSNSDGSSARSLIIDGRKNRALLSVSAGSSNLYGGISIPLNKWVFTAVSWNASSGKVSLYLADQNKNFSSISTNNINPKNANQFISLGGNPAAEDFFQGSMDELMIWDQILTMEEIRELIF